MQLSEPQSLWSLLMQCTGALHNIINIHSKITSSASRLTIQSITEAIIWSSHEAENEKKRRR